MVVVVVVVVVVWIGYSIFHISSSASPQRVESPHQRGLLACARGLMEAACRAAARRIIADWIRANDARGRRQNATIGSNCVTGVKDGERR